MQICLTQKQAEERFASVEPGIDYQLFFHLEKGKAYSGFGCYKFTLKNTSNVFLDFSGQNILTACVNGKNYSEEQIKTQWVKGHFALLPDDLKVGENHVEIQFTNLYNNDGNGLHSSVDAKGG